MNKLLVVLTLILCITVSCQDKKAIEELEDQNKALVLKLIENLNNGEIQIYEELCDPQYGFYSPSINQNPLSIEQTIEFGKMIFNAFPDASWGIEEIFAEGDRVVVWNIFSGTHEQVFQGIPPTGNKIKISSILMFRITNGKIIEEREEADMLGGMMQLGLELQVKVNENQ